MKKSNYLFRARPASRHPEDIVTILQIEVPTGLGHKFVKLRRYFLYHLLALHRGFEYIYHISIFSGQSPFNDFLSEGGKLWETVKQTVIENNVIPNLIKLIAECRKNQIQIIYAPHRKTQKGDYLNWNFLSPSHLGSSQLSMFEKGTWGGEFHPDLQPHEEDIIAQNHWTASGFANTDLDFMLKQHGKTHIVIAGMRANTCIDSTARYGVELGYHVTLIKDGIGAFNWDEIKATVGTNFPNYGHSLLTTNEFVDYLNEITA